MKDKPNPEAPAAQAEETKNVAAPVVEKKEAEGFSDPVKSVMRKTLGAIIEDAPIEEEKKEPEPEKVADGQPAGDEGEKKEPEAGDQNPDDKKEEQAKEPEGSKEPEHQPEPKLSREEIQNIIKGATREAVTDALSSEKKEPEKEAKKESEFIPEEQSEIDLAKFAAERDPAKFGSLPGDFERYFRLNRDFINNAITKNGSFDPKSEEYVEFQKANMPKLTRVEREQLRGLQIEERAVKQAEERIKAREAELTAKIRALEVRPVIEQERVSARNVMVEALPEEARKLIVAGDPKFGEKFKAEARIAVPVMQHVDRLINEYYLVASGAQKPDLEKNEDHKLLNELVISRGRELDAMPEEKRKTQDGKILVSRMRYMELRKSGSTEGYSTLSDSDVADMIKSLGRDAIKARIAAHEKELEEMGFVRKAKETKPSGDQQKVEEQQQQKPPPAKSTPSVGTSVKDVKAKAPSRFSSILNGIK